MFSFKTSSVHDPEAFIILFEVILIFFGSGLSYFAFERYSMTHVFEAFSVSLLIYISTRFYDEHKNLYAALIPIVLLIGLLVRWVNYYAFILPYITFLFFRKNIYDVFMNFTS